MSCFRNSALYQTALACDPLTLSNLARGDKSLHGLLNSPVFWGQKVVRDYPFFKNWKVASTREIYIYLYLTEGLYQESLYKVKARMNSIRKDTEGLAFRGVVDNCDEADEQHKARYPEWVGWSELCAIGLELTAGLNSAEGQFQLLGLFAPGAVKKNRQWTKGNNSIDPMMKKGVEKHHSESCVINSRSEQMTVRVELYIYRETKSYYLSTTIVSGFGYHTKYRSDAKYHQLHFGSLAEVEKWLREAVEKRELQLWEEIRTSKKAIIFTC